jgi:hypothetical protein
MGFGSISNSLEEQLILFFFDPHRACPARPLAAERQEEFYV